jgi:hypothetical protein
VLASAAIPGSVLWPLLLGSAVTLASTVVAQWVSLSYQTKRQREVRRADFQRTTLLQVRDALDDLFQGIRAVFIARDEALERTGDSSLLRSHHPSLDMLHGAIYRLRLLATALEDKSLRDKLELVTERAFDAAMKPTEWDYDEQLKKTTGVYFEVIDLLGEQLRRLP